MILEEEEEEQQQQPDPADQDTLVFDSKEEPFNTTIDTTSDDSAITMGKPVKQLSSPISSKYQQNR